MPPLTYPDEISYYGFCRTDDPYVKKAFPNNPVDPAEVQREAHEIHAWATAPGSNVPFEQFNARARGMESELARKAVASGKVVLAACGHDALGNSRPYDVEAIYEPLYRGSDLYHDAKPLLLRVLTAEEALRTWRGFLELARHPCFEDEPERFSDILHVFRSLRTLAREEDWIVVGLMRSYSLHKG